MSKTDVNREYQKELDKYRSQQVVLKALLAVKDDVEKIEPEIVESINVTYLSNNLNLDQEQVYSLFGTKHSVKSLEPIQKAKLMKYLTAKINTQCNDANNFAHQIKSEVQRNAFQTEDIRKQIELLLTEYNEKLVQLVNKKEKLCYLESLAVKFKTGPEQTKQLEILRLELKSKITEIERFKRILLHRMCNQTPKNTEALLKLKEFVDNLS